MLNAKIFGNLGWFVMGKGILHKTFHYIHNLTLISTNLKNVVLIADEIVWSIVGSVLQETCQKLGKEIFWLVFPGECTRGAVEKLKEQAENLKAELIIGAGGGKALDTSRLVSHELGKPLVLIPTSASTDAPTGKTAVIYSEKGEMEEIVNLPIPPDLVLVDTEIIVNAPVRFLVAGMGDALSAWFETKAAFNARGKNKHGGLPTLSSYALARQCYETIINKGQKAVEAAKRKVVTQEFEEVVESIVFISSLAHENGGVALSHAICNGLSVIPEAHKALHGEKVAFGILVQCLYEDDYESYRILRDFYSQIGLPKSLLELGLDNTKVKSAAERIVEYIFLKEHAKIHNEPVVVEKDKLIETIVRTHELGTKE